MYSGLATILLQLGFPFQTGQIEEEVKNLVENGSLEDVNVKFLNPISEYYGTHFKLTKDVVYLLSEHGKVIQPYELLYSKIENEPIKISTNVTDLDKLFPMPRYRILGDIVKRKSDFFIFEHNDFLLYFLNKTVFFRPSFEIVNVKESVERFNTALKYILTIYHHIYPNFITKEILSLIQDKRFTHNRLTQQVLIDEVTSKLNLFGSMDNLAELKEIQNDLKETEMMFERKVSELMNLESYIESVKIKRQTLYKTIGELEQAVLNTEENTLSKDLAEMLITKITTNPLIQSMEIRDTSPKTVKLRVRTNPIEITKYTQSPTKLLERRVEYTNDDLEKEVYKAFSDAYTKLSMDTDDKWQVVTSPVTLTITLKANNHNTSGYEIIDVSINARETDWPNPHTRLGCTGNYALHLDRASKEGNLPRFMNIFLEYMSSITIGDSAGDNYMYRTKLARKGERVQWTSSNLETVRNYLRRDQ